MGIGGFPHRVTDFLLLLVPVEASKNVWIHPMHTPHSGLKSHSDCSTGNGNNVCCTSVFKIVICCARNWMPITFLSNKKNQQSRRGPAFGSKVFGVCTAKKNVYMCRDGLA